MEFCLQLFVGTLFVMPFAARNRTQQQYEWLLKKNETSVTKQLHMLKDINVLGPDASITVPLVVVYSLKENTSQFFKDDRYALPFVSNCSIRRHLPIKDMTYSGKRFMTIYFVL